MSLKNRIVCSTILLAFLVGGALADMHAGTHLTAADRSDCSLCASYGNAGAAPADPAPLVLRADRPCRIKYLPPAVELSAGMVGALPRAPPATF